MGDDKLPVPFSLQSGGAGARAVVLPAGWPPDVAPNQVIFASHINAIRDSVALWPGDVDAQNHHLKNVILDNPQGVMVDPTTAAGDIVVRGAAAIAALPIGANGQFLTTDTSLPGKLKWATPIGQVASVFGRQGAVVAAAGDYTAAQVTNAVNTAAVYADPPWITALAWSKITGAPAIYPPSPHTHDAAEIVSGRLNTARLGTGIADASVFLRGDGTWAAPAGGSGGGAVSSVFGRAGAVIAQAGDYTAAMVTDAVVNRTSVRGDLLVRTQAGTIERLPAGGDGQALVADSSQAAGLRYATVSGTFIDPTTTRGDLLVRSSVAITRLPVGADGQVLTASNADALGVVWANPTGGGGGAVASVFGRTGAVVAAAGDYTAAQVLNAVNDQTVYTDPPWIASLAWSKIVSAPAFLVDPTTNKGDIIARTASGTTRVAVGSDSQVLTADSSAPTGLAWKTAASGGTPAAPVNSVQFNNAGLFGGSANLTWDNANGRLGVGTAPGATLHVKGGVALFQNDANGLSSSIGIAQLAIRGTTDPNKNLWVGFDTSNNVGVIQAGVAGSTWNNLLLSPSGGNVGIGTASALSRLSLGAANATAVQRIALYEASATNFYGIGMSNPAGFGVAIWAGKQATDTNMDFLVSNNGYVGVGSTNPMSKLSLGGVANCTNRIALYETTSSDFRGIGFANPGAGNYGVAVWCSKAPSDGNADFYVQDGGRVGVGIMTPGAPLTVNGGAQAPNLGFNAGVFTVTSSGVQLDVGMLPTGNFSMWMQSRHNTAGTAYGLCINPLGGYVAIGKTSISYPLDVQGDVNCTGVYRVNGTPIAHITTQTSPGRALNTVYQNTTGKPMMVMVTVTIGASSVFNIYTDAANPPTTPAGGANVTGASSVSFWVMPGNFYRVVLTGTGNLNTWVEWY